MEQSNLIKEAPSVSSKWNILQRTIPEYQAWIKSEKMREIQKSEIQNKELSINN